MQKLSRPQWARIAICLLFVVSAGAQSQSAGGKPNCKAVSARVFTQFKMRMNSDDATYPPHDAAKLASDLLIGGTGMSRSDWQAKVPGFFDWMVLATVRGWQAGFTGHLPWDPKSLSMWLTRECAKDWG